MDFDLEGFLLTYEGGRLSPAEGLALSDHATGCIEGAIVDIGASRGKSAVALAHGLGRTPARTDRRVFCIDPHRRDTAVVGPSGPGTRGDFDRVMLQTGFSDRAAVVDLNAVEAARGWRGPIGLLFIDRDHGSTAAKRELEAWEPHVMVGGVIGLHQGQGVGPDAAELAAGLIGSVRFARIESVGNVVFLRKLAAAIPLAGPRGKRIGVVCHDLVVAGSLFRFERFGRVAGRFGHQIAFIRLSPASQPARRVDFPVLTFDEAAHETWDVTIVPGAAFPAETVTQLDRFDGATFGLRMQHVLNDQTRKEAFLRVNSLFRPHVVVFNNRHWPPGSFTSFQANAFHFCEGAVDVQALAPDRYRPLPAPGQRFVIGGLAHKNPLPLIDAVRCLDSRVELRLFGPPGDLPTIAADLVDSGRLRLCGVLGETQLPGFYRDLDCVVHTRTFAGWANLAAEAMACGVPVICTPHGTLAFAEHERTALVIEDPNADAIRVQIDRIRLDPDLSRRLSHDARRRIVNFSWEGYTAELLRLMEPVDRVHYTWAPERGLFGKWPIEQRLRGLDGVVERCHGKTVLDLGAAEGLIAERFLDRGAALVHGFDRDPARVTTANGLCQRFGRARFWQGDLSLWSAFVQTHAARLQTSYDIVLYLGVHHHLSAHSRRDTLAGVASRASELLVVRTPEHVFRDDDMSSMLAEHGFEASHEVRADGGADTGVLRVFTRRRRLV